MNKLKLGSQIKRAIQINELAYQLERAYPHLDFYEISNLIKTWMAGGGIGVNYSNIRPINPQVKRSEVR